MSNVLLGLPLPVLLALIGVVLGMLVLGRALAGLRQPAAVRTPAEPRKAAGQAPHLRLVSGGGHPCRDREGA